MSKLAILVDGASVMVHDLDAGTVSNATPGAAPAPPVAVPAPVTDVIAALFLHAKGQDVPQTSGWWDLPQTGQASDRPTITLENGKPYTFDAVTVRTVYELTRVGPPCEVAIHIPGNGNMLTVDLVGKASGEVTGGAQSSVGAIDAPPDAGSMEGQLNSFRFRREVPAGQYANLYFRFDGGDPVLLLAVNPNS